MIISAHTAGLTLGLSQALIVAALPAVASSEVVTHIASDYLPNAKGALTPFNVDARLVNRSPETESWLASIGPSSGKTDEELAVLLIEAAYAHYLGPLNSDMTTNLAALLAAIASTAPATTTERRS